MPQTYEMQPCRTDGLGGIEACLEEHAEFYGIYERVTQYNGDKLAEWRGDMLHKEDAEKTLAALGEGGRGRAVHAAYLLRGFDNALQDAVAGHIEAAYRLSELAQIVSDLYIEYKDWDFPGVFDYEVTEPMGDWYASWQNCSDDDFLNALRLKFSEFMQQGDPRWQGSWTTHPTTLET